MSVVRQLVSLGTITALVLAASPPAAASTVTATVPKGAAAGSDIDLAGIDSWSFSLANTGANPVTVKVFVDLGGPEGFVELTALQTIVAATTGTVNFTQDVGQDVKSLRITATSALGTTISASTRCMGNAT